MVVGVGVSVLGEPGLQHCPHQAQAQRVSHGQCLRGGRQTWAQWGQKGRVRGREKWPLLRRVRAFEESEVWSDWSVKGKGEAGAVSRVLKSSDRILSRGYREPPKGFK